MTLATQSRFRLNSAVSFVSAGLFCALSLATASPVQARERLTLTDGSDVVCDHHAVVQGRVRVYLKAAEPDYFDLRADSVSAVENLPDSAMSREAAGFGAMQTKPAALTSSVPKPDAGRVFSEDSSRDAKLSPADLHLLLSKASTEHNVDEDLLASIVKAESGGHTRATSRAGAQGLMQLMPGTAHELGVGDSFAPDQNVNGGTAYLDALLTRYHDSIPLAVAAYNAGPAAVDRYHGIPPYRETRLYVARVVHEFNRRVAARRAAIRSNSPLRTAQTPTQRPATHAPHPGNSILNSPASNDLSGSMAYESAGSY